MPPAVLGLEAGAGRQLVLYNGVSKAGLFTIKTCLTNVGGRRLVCTGLEWVIRRVNNMESYVGREQKYTVLSGASATVISNRYRFYETIEGEPVLLRADISSFLHGSQAYRALIRKRLDDLFVKHYGAHAVGRKKAVDEQLKVTWKGERESLPNQRLVWRIGKGRWSVRGRSGNNRVSLSGKKPKRLLFPLGLRLRLLSGLAGAGRSGRVSLLLPWVKMSPITGYLGIGRVSGSHLSCVLASAEAGTNTIVFSTNRILPDSFSGGLWRIRNIKKGAAVKKPRR